MNFIASKFGYTNSNDFLEGKLIYYFNKFLNKHYNC